MGNTPIKNIQKPYSWAGFPACNIERLKEQSFSQKVMPRHPSCKISAMAGPSSTSLHRQDVWEFKRIHVWTSDKGWPNVIKIWLQHVAAKNYAYSDCVRDHVSGRTCSWGLSIHAEAMKIDINIWMLDLCRLHIEALQHGLSGRFPWHAQKTFFTNVMLC